MLSDSDSRQQQATLRRPFSIAGRTDTADGVILSVIYRVVGAATEWLSRRTAGDTVSVLGPMGNRFPKPVGGFGIFIGGGVGIPPMLYLADRWTSDESLELLAFCGATSRELLPLTLEDTPADELIDHVRPSRRAVEFNCHGVDSIISTDDGTYGFQGLVTDALEQYLDRNGGVSNDRRPVLYTCGPEGMMKRVAAIAAARGLDCFVAVERAMGCGMGTCQSCVIRVRRGEGWRYALSCTEGPIFRGDDLLW